MDKRALIVAGVILIIPIVMLVIWAVRGESMQGEFVQALEAGQVRGLHRDLQEKAWSDEELATVEVLEIPASVGREQALSRAMHSRGRIVLSPIQYAYQATIEDKATNLTHVFGFRRDNPRHWCWASFHPDQLQEVIRRRQQELEEMTSRESTVQTSTHPPNNQGKP